MGHKGKTKKTIISNNKRYKINLSQTLFKIIRNSIKELGLEICRNVANKNK